MARDELERLQADVNELKGKIRTKASALESLFLTAVLILLYAAWDHGWELFK